MHIEGIYIHIDIMCVYLSYLYLHVYLYVCTYICIYTYARKGRALKTHFTKPMAPVIFHFPPVEITWDLELFHGLKATC